jgi:uncharacterized protein YcbK (DUF882 family)
MPYNSQMAKFWTQIGLLLGILMIPAAAGKASLAKTLKFYHTHTRDQLEVTYFDDGVYLPDALVQVRDFLSDWRNGQQRDIDPALLDILWEIQRATGNDETFEVISAYRSEETNDRLRNRSKGVARNSQHILGKAIDVRLRGLDTAVLRDTALKLQRGGVGYYPQSDFIHVDTGRVRRW